MGWMLQYVDFYGRLKLSLQMSSCHRIVLCQVTMLCWQLQAKFQTDGPATGKARRPYSTTVRREVNDWQITDAVVT